MVARDCRPLKRLLPRGRSRRGPWTPVRRTLAIVAVRTSGVRQQSIWASVVSDDAPALVRWLLELGFTQDLLIPGEGDAIHHCQLDWPEGGRILGVAQRKG